MNNSGFIGKYGFFSSIVVAIIGVGIFSLPGELAKSVGNDGWLVSILDGLICLLLLYIIYKIMSKNNYDTFYNILIRNFGKVIGKIVAFIFSIYLIISISTGMRVFSEVLKMYLLEKTPTEFITLTMILCGYYLIRGSLTNLVRFNEVAFWIMFIPIFIVLIFAAYDADFSNVFPILNSSPVNYFQAISLSSFSFGGIGIIFLMLPALKNKSDYKKSAIMAVTFITIFYVVINVLCIASSSSPQVGKLLWPTIAMVKSISIPGGFIEGLEGSVMALWVIFYFTFFTNGLYFSSDLIKDIFGLEDIKISSYLVIPFIYLIALLPRDIGELYGIIEGVFPILFFTCLIFFPLILLLIIKLKKKVAATDEA
ncbi:MAG TPA: endospore germination permease [Clostridiaceae bacterium]